MVRHPSLSAYELHHDSANPADYTTNRFPAALERSAVDTTQIVLPQPPPSQAFAAKSVLLTILLPAPQSSLPRRLAGRFDHAQPEIALGRKMLFPRHRCADRDVQELPVLKANQHVGLAG